VAALVCGRAPTSSCISYDHSLYGVTATVLCGPRDNPPCQENRHRVTETCVGRERYIH
jgi:hypothetical protein